MSARGRGPGKWLAVADGGGPRAPFDQGRDALEPVTQRHCRGVSSSALREERTPSGEPFPGLVEGRPAPPGSGLLPLSGRGRGGDWAGTDGGGPGLGTWGRQAGEASAPAALGFSH